MKLELQDVSCGYGSRTVLRNISFTLQSGEVLCLLAPNGAGKTTLFKTILGLLKLQTGKVLIDGSDIRRWPRAQIARLVGYIPHAQHSSLPFQVLDMVVMGRTAYLGPFASPAPQDLAIAREAISMMRIEYLENKVYTEISGGERQLVLIARALAQQPRIMVMDEPTASLDFGNQLLVLSKVRQLAKLDLAIVMASHFPDHAFLYSTRVLMLKDGCVYRQGLPEETVTEASLRNLYGVEIRIVNANIDGDGPFRVCVPRTA